MFDILLTIAEKDFNKLRFVISSIQKYVSGFHAIHCISNVPVKEKFVGVQYHIDDEVIDFDFTKIDMENRRGWYKQQFIKLFQNVTADNYLVVDADVYINRPMEINIAHPFFLFGRDQYHLPYFRFMKEVLDLDKVYPHSFICETMFFKRSVMQYMLNELNVDKYEFFDICAKKINEINNGSSFSEYEMYGNYVTKNWKNFYQYKNIKVLHQHKRRQWTNEEIKSCISKYENTDYDILTMHTWL